MKTIVFTNRARFSGKTTSAVNIGAGLVRLGARVLLIDLDHSGALTRGLGIVAQELRYTLYDLLLGTASLDEVLLVRGRTGIIPASHHLSGIELTMIQRPNPILLVRDFMEKHTTGLKKFDYVLFDTPSNLGLLALNALAASECVIIPLAVGTEALSGIENVTRCIETVRNTHNGNLRLLGAVPVKYDDSNANHLDSLVGMKDYFGNALFQTPVRTEPVVHNALHAGYNVFEFDPDSRSTSDYMNISEELVLRN